MFKFRTLIDSRDKRGTLLSDAERLTPIGWFLRASSLNELPEPWNVLRGDMSLGGPRPLPMTHLPLYSPEQAHHHGVLPGITGWAQVNGRNAISWDEKFALDVWYVHNRTFWLGFKILFLTMKKVFVREGVSHGSDVTIPKFEGSGARRTNIVCQARGC